MWRCSVSGWNATVIDPFPIDAGRCRKTGHLCLQGGFIWSEGWWINQSQTILWNWEEQLRKNRHFVETNWIPAPINTNLMFFMQKKHPVEITSCWFPWTTYLKKTKKQNKQKTTGNPLDFVWKDLLERGKASVGDALAFPLHWSPKGQPQASSPLIRVLLKPTEKW